MSKRKASQTRAPRLQSNAAFHNIQPTHRGLTQQTTLILSFNLVLNYRDVPASLARACEAVFQKELSLSRQCEPQLVPGTHAQVCFLKILHRILQNCVYTSSSSDHRGLRSMQRKIRDVDCVLEVFSFLSLLFSISCLKPCRCMMQESRSVGGTLLSEMWLGEPDLTC